MNTGGHNEPLDLDFRPLTPSTWEDFEALFGLRGACGGCWCMWWRQTRKEFEAGKGESNRHAMKAIVDSGRVAGILAFNRGEPVGWCSVGAREEFSRLSRSRIFKPVDDRPVWSVVCLFVSKPHRRKGVATGLLRAAVDHAGRCGARIVEGYAVEPRAGTVPDAFAYPGLAASYREAGFEEVLRRSKTRPIMRAFIS